jgi:hypothetical protein
VFGSLDFDPSVKTMPISLDFTIAFFTLVYLYNIIMLQYFTDDFLQISFQGKFSTYAVIPHRLSLTGDSS